MTPSPGIHRAVTTPRGPRNKSTTGEESAAPASLHPSGLGSKSAGTDMTPAGATPAKMGKFRSTLATPPSKTATGTPNWSLGSEATGEVSPGQSPGAIVVSDSATSDLSVEDLGLARQPAPDSTLGLASGLAIGDQSMDAAESLQLHPRMATPPPKAFIAMQAMPESDLVAPPHLTMPCNMSCLKCLT